MILLPGGAFTYDIDIRTRWGRGKGVAPKADFELIGRMSVTVTRVRHCKKSQILWTTHTSERPPIKVEMVLRGHTKARGFMLKIMLITHFGA